MKKSPPSPASSAMAIFLMSEAVFFVYLIIAYVHFLVQPGARGEAGLHLDPRKTLIFTFFLVASSLTAWLAERASRRAARGRLLLWLVLSLGLGAVFVVGQGLEYRSLIASQVTVDGGLFGSAFFTLTGFHSLHLLAGLGFFAVLVALTACGGRHDGAARLRGALLGPVSLYWHFVDAVWLVIFSVVYLWGTR